MTILPPDGANADAGAPGLTAYLAPEGYVEELAAELGPDVERCDRLLLAPGPARPTVWAQNVWFDAERISITSIKQGAQALRDRQRNWALWPTTLHRRAQLIQDLLPHVSAKPLLFPAPPPTAPLGSWTLLDAATILAAARCASPFRHGEARFVEDRTAPPNRAYLKLWEALTEAGARPGPGSRCLDLGASPGGWTWVLQRTGATVISVDKAPLDPRIAQMPGVTVRTQSAFALAPDEIGPVDWLCSDIICYPQRLLTLVRSWLGRGQVRNFICTVKLQGEPDPAALAAFLAIPGARMHHLYHNKHELTWMLIR